MDVVIKSFNGSKPTGTYFLEDLEPEPVKKNQSRFRPAPQHWLRKFVLASWFFLYFEHVQNIKKITQHIIGPNIWHYVITNYDTLVQRIWQIIEPALFQLGTYR